VRGASRSGLPGSPASPPRCLTYHPATKPTTPPLYLPPRHPTSSPNYPRPPHTIPSIPVRASLLAIPPLHSLPTGSLLLSRTPPRQQPAAHACTQVQWPTTNRTLTLIQRTTPPPAQVSPTTLTRSPHPTTSPEKRRHRGNTRACHLAQDHGHPLRVALVPTLDKAGVITILFFAEKCRMHVCECKRLPRWTEDRMSMRSSLTWLQGTDSVSEYRFNDCDHVRIGCVRRPILTVFEPALHGPQDRDCAPVPSCAPEETQVGWIQSLL